MLDEVTEKVNQAVDLGTGAQISPPLTEAKNLSVS